MYKYNKYIFMYMQLMEMEMENCKCVLQNGENGIWFYENVKVEVKTCSNRTKNLMAAQKS